MRATRLDANDEIVFAGHDAARPRRKAACRHPRHVVRAEDRIDRKAFEQAVLHHGFHATAMLLRRLEDESNRAVEVAPLGKQLRRTENHGHMTVIPTGVHFSQRTGGMDSSGCAFGNVQCVHIGAQPDLPGSTTHP